MKRLCCFTESCLLDSSKDYARLMKNVRKIKADIEHNISLHNEIAADLDKAQISLECLRTDRSTTTLQEPSTGNNNILNCQLEDVYYDSNQI